jgi:hypothetical protein
VKNIEKEFEQEEEKLQKEVQSIQKTYDVKTKNLKVRNFLGIF